MNAFLAFENLPNLHPAMVHFPIVLIPLAIILELVAFVRPSLRGTSTVVFVAAAVVAFGAVKSGELAADGLSSVPPAAQPAIGEHSDWAHNLLWLLLAVGLLRLVVAVVERRRPLTAGRVASVLGMALAFVLVARVADLGGGLVYRHNLGVTPVASAVAPPPPPPTNDAADRLERTAEGSLVWRPSSDDADALGTILEPAPGFADETVTAVPSSGLGLEVEGSTLLVFDGVFGDVQVSLTVERGSFEGTLGLAHHVRDDGRGLFTVSTAGEARLSDLREGDEKVLDNAPLEWDDGRLELAISAAGRHLKGIVNGQTVVHGHIAAPPDGACGLWLDGRGTLRVIELTVVPVGGA